ncbi:hypothetical protein OXPF_17130 [Oxobacter pfennigii]|uniref:Uncharacterized protein n=1 Tax=Oxobacter pfennigii TaxID=36849 RepID=A0A0P8X1D8_9CLOT|nr:hypothetical protein [Oxobacter pfennigii]KPU44630.1 hypothetical protein OXPF_17130 [Oxobacter pfennigii]
MKKNTGFNILLVIFMTAVCIASILEIERQEFKPVQSTGYTMYDDREYLGYIFDDYNKSVNIEYVDKYCIEQDEEDLRSIFSFTSSGDEYSGDALRKLRSERIIEEEAQNAESAKSAGSSIINAYNSFVHGNMELNDKVDMLNLMRNLNESEILKLKRLFETMVTKSEKESILDALSLKYTDEEFAKLKSILNKYTA